MSQNSQNISRTHSNFFGIFARKLKRTGGPNSKNRGECSKKSRKLKSLGYPAQTHAGWWIRISRTPQGRWIDPGPSEPRSNGPQHGALDRVRTRPVQRLYKRYSTRFNSFSWNVSSLFSLLSSHTGELWWNPNPKLLNLTQNLTRHGSNVSSRCSKHESITRNRMHPLNHRRSWIFFHGFQTVFGSFFCSNLCSDKTTYGFIGLQRLIHVVNRETLYGFEIFLGFQFFWTEPFELLRIYVDSDSLMFLSMKEVSFSVHLCFIRRFELELSGFFGFDSVLLILAWNPKINRWFFFFFFTGSKPLNFFPFSSQFLFSVIVLDSLLSVTNPMLELQRKRLNDEDSSSNLWELPWIPWILAWIEFWKTRVCASCSSIFLSLLWFWSNWMERENLILFVTWQWFCGPPLIGAARGLI